MKNLYPIGLLCILILSCTNQRKAFRWFNEHPEDAAGWCADNFPPVDSVGTPIYDTTRKANNIDYSAQIDSLNNEIKALEGHVQAVISAGESDVDIVQAVMRKELLRLQQKLSAVQAKLDRLSAQYKPCEPDTLAITTPIYRANDAREKQLKLQKEALQAKIESLLAKIEKMTAKYEQEQEAKEKWRKRFFILAGIVAIYIALRIFAARLPFKIV